MNKIPCEIIQDLFPSYIDGLTSAATNAAVEEHVADCENCTNVLDAMRNGTDANAQALERDEEQQAEKAELDFLKRTRRKHIQRTILIAAGVAVLALLLIGYRFFIAGSYADGDRIVCNVTVDGNDLILEAASTDLSCRLKDVNLREEDGIVQVLPTIVAASPLYGQVVYKEQHMESAIRQVRLGSRILWADGSEVSALASSVYATRHHYVGNMPANVKTANALNLSNYLGPYLNELQTEEEPFGWSLEFIREIPLEQKDLRESDMDSFGYILLSMVGNLGEVTYQYRVEGKGYTKTVTMEDASEFFGQDIKDCMENIRLLDDLIRKTGLDRYMFVSRWSPSEDRQLRLQIINNLDIEIHTIVAELYKDGQLIETSGGQYADNTPIIRGDKLLFELYQEVHQVWDGETYEERANDDWEEDASLELQIQVETKDGEWVAIPERLRVGNDFYSTYEITITGNLEEGLSLAQ